MSHTIFISLTEQDTPIAVALQDALRGLVGDALEVHFSTSKQVGSGPDHGDNWMTWIVDQVKQCDFALVLLTPASIQKPWIVWETGAVHGAAMMLGEGGRRKVRPLVFQVTDEQLPSPIRETHAEFRRGDQADDVELLFTDIIGEYYKDKGIARIKNALDGLKTVMPKYLAAVSAALLRAPGVPTAVAVDEWLSRLDALLKENRKSEVPYLQDWMEIAFGRQSATERRPIDLRVHTRLGEVYLGMRNYARAVQQFELARLIAPRDIYVLRSLGRAYLETKDKVSAGSIIDRIVELDENALSSNPECAALDARYLRESGKLTAAMAVLGAALEHNPDSYYLANLQGEISLEANDRDQAKASFGMALKILGRLHETNIWTHATAANAAFVVGDDGRAIEGLKAIVAGNPNADALATVERGLRRLAPLLDDGDRRMARFAEVLHPRSEAATAAPLEVRRDGVTR